MDLEHSFTVDAPVDTVWPTMMDIEGVAECFPGATVTSAEGDSFEGTCKVKLGPIALVYKGSGSFVERDDAGHRAVIEAKGKDKRGNGTAGATVTMTMATEGSGTRVDVVTDLNVTGKPAQFGRGVMQDVSDKLLGQFVDCLARKFDEGETSAPPTGTKGGEPSSDDGAQAAPAEGGSSAGGTDEVPPASGGAAPAAAAMPASAVAAAAETLGQPTATSGSAAPSAGASGSAGASSGSSARGSSGDSDDDVLDLGAAMVPPVVREYGPYVAIAVVAYCWGWLKGRFSRR